MSPQQYATPTQPQPSPDLQHIVSCNPALCFLFSSILDCQSHHLPASYLEVCYLASTFLSVRLNNNDPQTSQLANHGVNTEETVPEPVLKYSMYTTLNIHPTHFVHDRGARTRRRLERCLQSS
jgi:hypothetical protein